MSQRTVMNLYIKHMIIKKERTSLRFSEIQKKEVIDGHQGKFLGFVQDATIDTDTGMVEALHVSDYERGMLFDFKKSELKKIRISDIEIIGKDIVLVYKKE